MTKKPIQPQGAAFVYDPRALPVNPHRDGMPRGRSFCRDRELSRLERQHQAKIEAMERRARKTTP